MTDYTSHSNRRASWKRRQINNKWREILAVFITVVLVFLIINGFLRGLALKSWFSGSIWNGRTVLAIAVNSKPPSLIVYQNEPRRITTVVLPEDLSFATGDYGEPIKNVQRAFEEDSEGGRLFLTKYLGVNVAGFVTLKEAKKMDRAEAQNIFGDFAFLTTPFVVSFNGLERNVQATNLSRVDLMRLWWQVKGLSVDDLVFVDLNNYVVEIIGGENKKFKSLDRDLVRRAIAKYFESEEVLSKKVSIEVNNASGVNGIGTLASEIAEMAGFSVANVTGSDSTSEETKVIVSEKSDQATHLAKIFNCDIVWRQNEAESSKITLVIGSDFAKRFQ